MNHNFPWCYDQTKFFHLSIYILEGWLQKKTRLCNSTKPVVEFPFCLFFAFGIILLRLSDNPNTGVHRKKRLQGKCSFSSPVNKKRGNQSDRVSHSGLDFYLSSFLFLLFVCLFICLFFVCVFVVLSHLSRWWLPCGAGASAVVALNSEGWEPFSPTTGPIVPRAWMPHCLSLLFILRAGSRCGLSHRQCVAEQAS